ncbi:MAG TPA: CbiX/SirB N-terminal domain-containing protein [Micromonosporaceae bacterium]|nr:CbiX/SirB N-terminal domain-containing protein [Micromonosporaceae bacterium]
MTTILLLAHGSRDPRAAVATAALVRAVSTARPGVGVRAAYLEHALPRPAQVLSALEATGEPGAVLVPLLMTAAYHGRVDLPATLAAARGDGLRLPVAVADVLGPTSGRVPAELPAGLHRRLHQAGGGGFDSVVLAAAGTRMASARGSVEQAAAALGNRLGVPVAVAYASAAGPTPGEAVARLRAAGARRVAMAAYFLAPGRLYDAAATSARAAGAIAVAEPLTDAPELVALVLARADAVSARPALAVDQGLVAVS